ncbi:MAG: amidohydrolase family protein [Bryobacteraceae bacterium]
MQTPWGSLAVSDAHVHFLSHGLFTTLASQSRTLPKETAPETIQQMLGWYPPVEPERLAEEWVRELDRHQVARAALIASVPGDESSVVAAIRSHPDRFHGYFMLNPLAPDALDRTGAALQAGMKGVCLFPAMQRFSIADERLEPLLQLAAGVKGAIVFVHCGVLSVGIRKRLGVPSPFDMRYSNPIDLHPVALRHPGARFVIPHFGAGYFREALMVCDLCPNVYLDTSSTNGWTRYHTPALSLAGVFQRALEVAGPQRLLFGSDSSLFPRGWHARIFTEQAETLQHIGISGADAAKIFGGNLERMMSGD